MLQKFYFATWFQFFICTQGLAVSRTNYFSTQYFENLYKNAVEGHNLVEGKIAIENLMAATLCAHKKYGYQKAKKLIETARKNVMTSDEKMKNYFKTMALAPKVWKMPSQAQLAVTCHEEAL